MAAALSAFALAACAVGPDYRAPETAPASFARAEADTVVGAGLEARWWTQLGDPALSGLVEQALHANRDLALAVSRVEEARALFRDQRNDAFPVVTASGSAQKGEAAQLGASSTGPRGQTESLRLGFDAAWELDLFGRVRRGTEAARADAEAAQASLHEAQVLVAAEVARNYFEWRGSAQQLDVAERNRDSQQETLRLTQVRYDAGRGTELDVASARARLAATEAGMPLLETQRRRAEHRLAVLLGQRPGVWQPPAAATITALNRPLPVGEAGELLRRRPDIARAAAELHAATARVGVATADYFPRLSLSGFAGFSAGSFGDLGAASRAWSAGPTLSWAAFDLGSVAARVDAADARSRGAAARYEQTVLTALEETENAFVAVSQSRQRLRHTLDQAAAARRAAELARIQYKAGVIDFLVLLDAERSLLAAEDAVAASETAVNTAAVALYKALGGGWGGEPEAERA
ncbi:efflux transporter outer membrane subunit [Stagnimonas aquatica]|uniref:Efflux transporter outer membrane subunit n=1 Tax=Stagnimonas aquatica TaxID=2689987 RepID=A0A3N0VKZ3_9GAMM|nr:efflux transporter outer membrane subunit [Stagnimonas aquatica]ROH93380.1 efflux transporter outer membrane subunit [Stagnimonas aquatica]